MSEFYDHEYYHDTTESGSVEEPSPNRQTMPGSGRRAHKPGKKLSLIKKLGICAAFAAVFGLVAGGVYTGVTAFARYRMEAAAGSSGSNDRDWDDLFDNDRGDDDDNGAGSDGEAGKETEAADSGASMKASFNTGSRVKDTAITGSDMSTEAISSALMPAMVAITNTSVEEVRNYFGAFFGQSMEPQLRESTSMGTGVIIGEDDSFLYIASNEHVVADANELTAAFIDNTAATAEVVGEDSANDLAVIRVSLSDLSEDTLDAIRIAVFGDSADLRVGQTVIAIGNALGYGQSVSRGIVSALNRTLSNGEGIYAEGLIQTDAAINPGNSGGALLNEKGELIGINSAKYASTEVEGMGFAIPLDKAYPIFSAMISGTYDSQTSGSSVLTGDACLGINCIGLTESRASYYNLPVGIYITAIVENGAADKAGLQVGDVITSFNGTAVSTVDELTSLLNGLNPGDKVTVIASRSSGRSYESRSFSVSLSSRQALS